MKITDVSNTSINWDIIPITRNSGETGNTYQRTIELGNIRLRIAEYSLMKTIKRILFFVLRMLSRI